MDFGNLYWVRQNSQRRGAEGVEFAEERNGGNCSMDNVGSWRAEYIGEDRDELLCDLCVLCASALRFS
jgi:hypothetical protein